MQFLLKWASEIPIDIDTVNFINWVSATQGKNFDLCIMKKELSWFPYYGYLCILGGWKIVLRALVGAQVCRLVLDYWSKGQVKALRKIQGLAKDHFLVLFTILKCGILSKSFFLLRAQWHRLVHTCRTVRDSQHLLFLSALTKWAFISAG